MAAVTQRVSFDAATRDKIERALAAAVSSAAATQLRDMAALLRHIALALLPEDDAAAVCRVRELLHENRALREQSRPDAQARTEAGPAGMASGSEGDDGRDVGEVTPAAPVEAHGEPFKRPWP